MGNYRDDAKEPKPRSSFIVAKELERLRAAEKDRRDAMSPLARLIHDLTQEEAKTQLVLGVSLDLMRDPEETVRTLKILKGRSDCAEYNVLCDEIMSEFTARGAQ